MKTFGFGKYVNVTYIFLAAFFCTATLFLSLVISQNHEVGYFGVETDFYGAYAEQTENLLAKRPYTHFHNPPGYCILLALITLIKGDMFTSAKILTAFSTAAFGFLTFLLFYKIFDERVALLSTFLLLISLLKYSYLAATDMVGAFFILVPIFILLYPNKINLKLCFFSGIFCGIAYLIRTVGLFLLPGIAFSLIFLLSDNEELKGKLAKVVILIIGFFFAASPWLLYNWKMKGSLFYSTAYLQIGAHFLTSTGDKYGTALKQIAKEYHSTLDIISQNIFIILKKYITGVFETNIRALATNVLIYPAYLFAGSGLILLLKDLSKKKASFLLIILLGYFSLGLVGFYPRYYFFLYPFLFLMMTYSLFEKNIYELLNGVTRSKLHISYIIFSVLLLFIVRNTYSDVKKRLATEPKYLIEIAEFMKKESSIGDKMIIRKPHLAYLSEMKSYFPLCENPNAFFESAKSNDAKFLVYSDYAASLWPGLKQFANPEQVSEHFRLIYHHQPTNTLIYKIMI